MQAKSLAELSLQFRLSGWQLYTISWVLIHDYQPTDIQEPKQILTANKSLGDQAQTYKSLSLVNESISR